MTDTGRVGKIVVFIGLMMLLINLLYPGANPAWSTLETTIQTGPNFPTFNNPLHGANYTQVVLPGEDFGNQPNAKHRCTDYIDCLNTWDAPFISGGVPLANASYVEYNSGPGGTYAFQFLEQGYSTGGLAITVAQVNVTCSSGWAGTVQIRLDFYPSGNSSLIGYTTFVCQNTGPFGLAYQSAPLSFNGAGPFPANLFSNARVNVSSSTTNKTVNIGFIGLRLLVEGGTRACGSTIWDTGCVLAQFFGSMVLYVQLFVNFIVYAVSWLAAVLLFIGSIIINVLLGIVLSLFYFYALPGAPTIVQAAVDVIMTALLVIVLAFIIGYAVGVLGGVANKA